MKNFQQPIKRVTTKTSLWEDIPFTSPFRVWQISDRTAAWQVFRNGRVGVCAHEEVHEKVISSHSEKTVESAMLRAGVERTEKGVLEVEEISLWLR